ncbi:Faf1 protein [Candida orthopsilosis Co 90-125]|uniref:Faf1 protein n=1 Tax=Candida orthopsilosis (strain 90-125) TaxID=1136231 RepID=H8WZA9_CANO9|nr:Faf1 protein [Candida orthopsilosis Co 90-125]CCG21777.1 Faf1 protein [Candida orthopsilosis Co 90-125]
MWSLSTGFTFLFFFFHCEKIIFNFFSVFFTIMSEDAEYIRALEIQRRNFEAQFGSIGELGFGDKLDEVKSEESSTSEPSDEEGIKLDGLSSESENSSLESEDDELFDIEDQPKPKVVKLNTPTTEISHAIPSKTDRKLLKSGRAATLSEIEAVNKRASKQNLKQANKTAKEESDNLENDLKLQRLLKESHILANNVDPQFSGADLTLKTIDFEDPTGKSRKRVLSSRIQELSTTNLAKEKKLESMPMNMRKGMIAKRDARVAKYEKEARDAGIVLSKLKKGQVRDLNAGRGSTSSSDRLGSGKTHKVQKRERGLKINGVGRSTRNGLVISQNDIDRINSQGKRRHGKKR